MTSTKYIGMDVHKESISIAVRNAVGKIVMECVIETKANMILQCIDGLRGDLHVTFEEGTSAAWLYDLLKPHVTELIVCDPRKNASLSEDNQNDKIDARRLAELLRIDHLSPVYHGEHGLRTLKELVRSYLTVTKDLVRVWLTNCYFAHNSLRFPALLPFLNASSRRPFHSLNRHPEPVVPAWRLITLSDDWYDHYGAQAMYLRLNGILPPTAQPAK